MRRSDRQVTDPQLLEEMLSQAKVCVLGLDDPQAGVPYLVPLNFGYLFDKENLRLYFHCAPVGKKLRLMEENAHVSFVIAQQGELITGPTACAYSANFFSIMGQGTLVRVIHEQERRQGLDLLMLHHDPAANLQYQPEMLARTVVLRLDVQSYTAKRQQR